jgi:four helix bundle protein
MDNFEQFDAFQRSREFTRAVADLLNRGTFSRDPGLVAHLRKTLLSIYSNFAEGFGRDGNREFVQFVSITKASVSEVQGQLLYAVDFGYLAEETYKELDLLAKTAIQCLWGLMRYLNNSNNRGKKFALNESMENSMKQRDQAPISGNRGLLNAKRETPNDKR